MRLFPHLVAVLAVFRGAKAIDQKKAAVIWFDDPATPDHVIEQAKESILRAGGKITHVYSLIKGFAVIAPVKELETLQATTSEHNMRVEDDEMMFAQD